MQYLIDTQAATIRCLPDQDRDQDQGQGRLIDFYSQEGFRLLSGLWLKQEWNLLHWQSFSWLGFQIWQLPEDLLRIQEVIADLRPDVILETGVKRGGSAIFFASLCRLLGRGRVISIDIDIPHEVRAALATSPLGDLITLIKGDSVAPPVVAQARALIGGGDRVLVFLDSNHTKAHVLAELAAYADLVTPGSYVVVTDGVMRSLASTPAGCPAWVEDNPAAAAQAFAAAHPDFVIDRPRARFRDECWVEELTYWPDAWLIRLGPPAAV